MKATLFIPLLASLCLSSGTGSFTLLEDDTLEVPVAQYRTVRFEVATEMSENAGLSGELRVIPDTSSLELILMHIDDYMRWREGVGEVDTLGYLEVSAGTFELDVPGLGEYALVVSNRGNYRPATVFLDIDLLYEETGSGDPLPAAMKFTLLLIAAGAAAFAIGSVLVRYLKKSRHTD